MALSQRTIIDDILDPRTLWNDFKPQPTYHPVSDLYGALAIAACITLAHLFLDKFFNYKARTFADEHVSRSRTARPKWIPSDLEQLSYAKLQWLNPKTFAKIVPKKYEQFSGEQQRELMSFQKACATHSKHISKYQEALFKVVVFGAIYAYGLVVIYLDGKWLWDSEWMWQQTAKAMPQAMGTHPIFNLKYYYELQIAYALHRAYYQFLEHTRRDFWAMFLHHWVSAALLVGSYVMGYCQIGATVLLCNDNCDLLMPLAKLCSYSGYRSLEMVFTIAFCVLWIPMRIGVYGYKVMWSILVIGYAENRQYIGNLACTLGLLIIYLLQFFWTKYLLEMVWSKLMKGKGVVDVRSDDEGSTNQKR